MRPAVFSEDRIYRYTLWRRGWGLKGEESTVNFIGLNPSTADEINNDPTVRRCIGFARSWGFTHLVVTNIFAFRATDPVMLIAAPDPVGPENNRYLLSEAKQAQQVVAAWSGMYPERAREVRDLLTDVRLYCLGLTKSGAPRHPLYMPAATQAVRFQ